MNLKPFPNESKQHLLGRELVLALSKPEVVATMNKYSEWARNEKESLPTNDCSTDFFEWVGREHVETLLGECSLQMCGVWRLHNIFNERAAHPLVIEIVYAELMRRIEKSQAAVWKCMNSIGWD